MAQYWVFCVLKLMISYIPYRLFRRLFGIKFIDHVWKGIIFWIFGLSLIDERHSNSRTGRDILLHWPNEPFSNTSLRVGICRTKKADKICVGRSKSSRYKPLRWFFHYK